MTRVTPERLRTPDNSAPRGGVVDTFVAPVRGGETTLSALARSLGVATDAVGQMYKDEQRYRLENEQMLKTDAERRHRALLALQLRNSTTQTERELSDEYLSDPELQRAPLEQIDAWLSERTAPLIETVDDPEMKVAYGNSLNGIRQNMLAKHNERLRDLQKATSIEELGVSFTSALSQPTLDYNDYATNLRNFATTNLGLSKQEVDEVLINVAVNGAYDPNNPTLRGIEYLRQLKHPAGGTIADIPQFKAKLDAAEAAFFRATRENKAKEDEMLKLQWMKQMQDEAHIGLYDPSKEQEALAVGLSPSQLVGYRETAKKEQERQGFITDLITGLRNEDPVAVATTPLDKKSIEEAMDRFAMENEEILGDEIAAANLTAQKALKVAVMPPRHKALMEKATTANPEAFMKAAGLYEVYERVEPNFLNSAVTETQRRQFDIYLDEVKYGRTPEEALEFTKRYSTEFGKREGLITPEERRDIARSVDAVMEDTGWFNGDAKNTLYAKAEVKRRANRYMVGNMATNPKQAAEMAIKEFKANHTYMNGMYVYTHGRVIPETVREALPDTIGYIKENLLKGTPYEDDDVIILPDQHTTSGPEATWGIYTVFDGLPVPYLGKNNRVNVKEVVQRYIDRISEETRQKQADENSKIDVFNPGATTNWWKQKKGGE